MSILHANRSACFYNADQHEAALDDIKTALLLPYPKHLHHKLHEREARCHMAFDNLLPAVEAFKRALVSLDDCQLESSVRMKKNSDFGIMIELLSKTLKSKNYKNNKKIKTISKLPPVPQLSKPVNHNYQSASNAVTFDSNQEMGRFAVAAEAIKAGNI